MVFLCITKGWQISSKQEGEGVLFTP